MNSLDTPRHRHNPLSPLALTLILVTLPQAAPANETRMAWNLCAGDGGSSNQTFACDTNVGRHDLVGSFLLSGDAAFPGGWGIEARIVIGTGGTDSRVPNWWRFAADGCRSGSLTTSFDFVSDPMVACIDPYSGQALGSPTTIKVVTTPDLPPHGSSTYQRVTFGAYMPTSAAFRAGVEYAAFKVRINDAKTRGSASCSGCCEEMLILLEDFRVYDDSSSWLFPSQPVATWQSGGSPCQATGRVPRSWGQIRSLYR